MPRGTAAPAPFAPPARLCDNCRPGCARTEASPSPRREPSLQSLAPWLMISAPRLEWEGALTFSRVTSPTVQHFIRELEGRR